MFLSPKMEPKRIKLEDLRVKEFKLPLRNKKGEIVAYTLVDEDDFERFKHLRFHLGYGGYANNDLGSLHRLITGAKKGEIVDHINGNRLDNRKENLRIVTHSENARNRTKNVNTSSNYYGVAWGKRDSKWICFVRVDNKDILFNFDKEDHAAYYRDVLIKRYNLFGCKLNGLEKPDDFVDPKERKKSKHRIGVCKVGYKFRAEITWNFSRIFIGSFDTLEKAQQAYKNKKEKLEKESEEKKLTTPIKRNENGKAIIELFNKKKEKVGETTISDHRYYDVINYGWCYSRGRVSGRVDGKTIKLHRFLMNAKPGDLVDHIDRNPLNNEMENLRFSNHKLNAHNRSKSKNATSQYFGVHFRKLENAFAASIKKDRKTQYIGYFKDELEAAKAYDKKAIELYGDKARLNFPL